MLHDLKLSNKKGMTIKLGGLLAYSSEVGLLEDQDQEATMKNANAQ